MVQQLQDSLQDFKENIQDWWSERQADASDERQSKRWPIWLVAIYLIVTLIMGFVWSDEPEQFDVRQHAREVAQEMSVEPVVGFTTTATLMRITETLLDKQGGYLSNDIFPPGLWLDNIPNWEFGVLVQVRDFSRALRKDFSRSQSQSTEDPNLSIAEPQLHFDNTSWAIPSSESEYRRGLMALNDYLIALSDANESAAQFYARSDNLRQWLFDVETRLGSLSQRLSASVGKRRLNTDVGTEYSTPVSVDSEVKTPWTEIDDTFYEARGSAWALLQILKGIEVDFQVILEKKNALVSLRQIIRELESTQSDLSSPIILNGGGFGLFANHSLVMASYISRANAAILDLRELLSQG